MLSKKIHRLVLLSVIGLIIKPATADRVMTFSSSMILCHTSNIDANVHPLINPAQHQPTFPEKTQISATLVITNIAPPTIPIPTITVTGEAKNVETGDLIDSLTCKNIIKNGGLLANCPPVGTDVSLDSGDQVFYQLWKPYRPTAGDCNGSFPVGFQNASITDVLSGTITIHSDKGGFQAHGEYSGFDSLQRLDRVDPFQVNGGRAF